jgi:quercetin dioxygenase-like cupin family protein
MLTRRDLVVAVVAASFTIAAVAWAQSPRQPFLTSTCYDWNEMRSAPTPTGAKREICRTRTATLDQLQIHVTTVNAHQQAHDPHRHWEEEVIIVKEGTVESMQNGETTRLGPGSVIFEASNELHGIRNVGDTPASYYVIKFWPPESLAASQD